VSSLGDESARLSTLESAFWQEYSAYTLSASQLVDEQNFVQEQIRHASEALERIKRTNVFDDAFHISHDGHFATINGFRLGRLPSQPVEWAEISAALGQALLLLATMARQTDYKFQKSAYMNDIASNLQHVPGILRGLRACVCVQIPSDPDGLVQQDVSPG